MWTSYNDYLLKMAIRKIYLECICQDFVMITYLSVYINELYHVLST